MGEQRDPERGDHARLDYGKDAGFWLLPRRPLIALAHVFQIGADKYAPRGWEAGMEWSRVVDPLFRHLLKWLSGEKYDPVDGQHHLASVIWACMVLMEYEETHPELDNLARDKIGQPVTQPNIQRPARWQEIGGYVDSLPGADGPIPSIANGNALHN
jgi:hypothetical protein